MFPITGSEFFIRVKGSYIFKEEEDIEVGIFVYINSVCFRHFTISTKDPIWENPFYLFERLGNQTVSVDILPDNKTEKNTFIYYFINSKTGILVEDSDIVSNMVKMSI